MNAHTKRWLADRLGLTGMHLLLVAVALFTLLPFFWMLSTSFKSAGGILTYPPQWIPKQPTAIWYFQLIKEVNFLLHFRNSLIVAVSITTISLFLNSLAGYAFAKFRFQGRDKIFSLLLATMMIPGQVTMIPVFLLLKKLGFLNSFMGLIVPAGVNVFGIFLITVTILSGNP